MKVATQDTFISFSRSEQDFLYRVFGKCLVGDPLVKSHAFSKRVVL